MMSSIYGVNVLYLCPRPKISNISVKEYTMDLYTFHIILLPQILLSQSSSCLLHIEGVSANQTVSIQLFTTYRLFGLAECVRG